MWYCMTLALQRPDSGVGSSWLTHNPGEASSLVQVDTTHATVVWVESDDDYEELIEGARAQRRAAAEAAQRQREVALAEAEVEQADDPEPYLDPELYGHDVAVQRAAAASNEAVEPIGHGSSAEEALRTDGAL